MGSSLAQTVRTRQITTGHVVKIYGGLTGCVEIAGLNLNPHEQNHARKGVHLRSFNTITVPRFVYYLRVLNELQNEKYNHRTLRNLLRGIAGHSESTNFGCWSLLVRCGRCFCSNPVMRVFDRFGRVDIVPLSSEPQGQFCPIIV